MNKIRHLMLSITTYLLTLFSIFNCAYAVQYEIIDIGTLGGDYGYAYGINNNREVTFFDC